jgi:transcriptional regulator with XRE-family HTH domain
MSEFSERLQNLREENGWTKTYVAGRLGIKMQTYANYEYGRREPDIDLINQIAKLFNTSTDYLLNGKESSGNPVDLDDAIDNAMSFDGRPVTEHDRQMMKQLWKAYMDNKD